MEKLSRLDRDLFLWFNGLHTPWLDPVMFYATKTWLWIPFYGVIAWLIYRTVGRATVAILIGIAVAVTLADRITTGLMKPYFLRPRPTHEPAIQELVHTVNGYYGGDYGFASSHAANVFAVALLVWLVLRKKYRWSGLVFIWAAFVAYTRVYLGVHYPGDILGGAVVGSLCGGAGYWLARWLSRKFDVSAGDRPAS